MKTRTVYWNPTKTELEALVDRYTGNEFDDAISLSEHIVRNSGIEMAISHAAKLFNRVHARYLVRQAVRAGRK